MATESNPCRLFSWCIFNGAGAFISPPPAYGVCAVRECQWGWQVGGGWLILHTRAALTSAQEKGDQPLCFYPAVPRGTVSPVAYTRLSGDPGRVRELQTCLTAAHVRRAPFRTRSISVSMYTSPAIRWLARKRARFCARAGCALSTHADRSRLLSGGSADSHFSILILLPSGNNSLAFPLSWETASLVARPHSPLPPAPCV